MALLLISLVPALWALCRRSHSTTTLVRALVFVSLSSFMVGYHVHEKAVLVPMVLQTLLCQRSERDRVLYLLLVSAGVHGLFPLFTGLPELLLKGAALSHSVCALS